MFTHLKKSIEELIAEDPAYVIWMKEKGVIEISDEDAEEAEYNLYIINYYNEFVTAENGY